MENTLENAKLFMKRRISLHLQGGDARQKQITRAMFEYANEVLQQHSVMQAEGSDGYLGHAHGYQPTNTVDTSTPPKQSADGAAVASSAVGSQTSARDFFCMTGECGKQCEPCKTGERF